MKIVWLSHIVPYPPKAGHLQRSFNLIRELASKHEVHLLAFNQKALLPTPQDVASSVEALRQHCATVRAFPIPSQRTSLSYLTLLARNVLSPLPYSIQMLHSSDMVREAQALNERVSVDAVHVDVIEMVPYAKFFPAARKVLNHHNVESELLKRRGHMMRNPLAKLYLFLQAHKLKAYECRHMAAFDHNFAVSEPDRQLLLQRAPQVPVSVIANGVDVEYFTAARKSTPEPRTLLFVGNMAWFPNHDAVVYFMDQMWHRLCQALPGSQLLLVGPGEKAIDRFQGVPGVRICGFVDDVRPYLERATCVIVPIRVGGGTRLKILDALSSAKAVVSTSIGCEGLDVQHERDILIADTPEAFVQLVKRVCEDEPLRARLGEAGRRLVESTYSWRLVGQRMISILEDLIDPSRP